MRFTVAGKQYALEFKRTTLHVLKRGEYVDRSKNLFTYAIVREVQEGEKDTEKWPIAHEAFVGCHPSDQYTPEGGRRAALKKLCKLSTVPDEIKAGVWQAFFDRLDGTSTKHMSNKQLRSELAKARKEAEASGKALKVALEHSKMWQERYSNLLKGEEE